MLCHRRRIQDQVRKDRLLPELLDVAAAFELTPDTGMLYDNIKPISERKAEYLQQWFGTQAATTTETLRLARYFFDKLFKPEVDADTKGAF